MWSHPPNSLFHAADSGSADILYPYAMGSQSFSCRPPGLADGWLVGWLDGWLTGRMMGDRLSGPGTFHALSHDGSGRYGRHEIGMRWMDGWMDGRIDDGT